MRFIGTGLKRNKKYLKILLILFLFSLFLTLIIYQKSDHTMMLEELKNINNYLIENKINFILPHTSIIFILSITSMIGIGLVLFPIYLIYEIMSILYSLFSWIECYHLNGFIYGILYNILTKGIYLILLILLYKYILQIVKYMIYYKKEKNSNFQSNILIYSKKIVITAILLLLNDIFIYLFLNHILLKLTFILK